MPSHMIGACNGGTWWRRRTVLTAHRWSRLSGWNPSRAASCHPLVDGPRPSPSPESPLDYIRINPRSQRPPRSVRGVLQAVALHIARGELPSTAHARRPLSKEDEGGSVVPIATFDALSLLQRRCVWGCRQAERMAMALADLSASLDQGSGGGPHALWRAWRTTPSNGEAPPPRLHCPVEYLAEIPLPGALTEMLRWCGRRLLDHAAELKEEARVIAVALHERRETTQPTPPPYGWSPGDFAIMRMSCFQPLVDLLAGLIKVAEQLLAVVVELLWVHLHPSALDSPPRDDLQALQALCEEVVLAVLESGNTIVGDIVAPFLGELMSQRSTITEHVELQRRLHRWRASLTLSCSLTCRALSSQKEDDVVALRLARAMGQWNEEISNRLTEDDVAQSNSKHHAPTDVWHHLQWLAPEARWTLVYILAQHGRAMEVEEVMKAWTAIDSTLDGLPLRLRMSVLARVHADACHHQASTKHDRVEDLYFLLQHSMVVPTATLNEYATVMRRALAQTTPSPSPRNPTPLDDGLLSPALVWGRGAHLPAEQRSALCWMCVHINRLRGGGVLSMEDVYLLLALAHNQRRQVDYDLLHGSGWRHDAPTYGPPRTEALLRSAQRFVMTEVGMSMDEFLADAYLQPHAVKSFSPAAPIVGSVVLFKAAAKELLLMIARRCARGERIGTMWESALRAATTVVESTDVKAVKGEVVEFIVMALAQEANTASAAPSPKCTRAEAVVQFAPLLSTFAMAHIIQSTRVVWHLKWTQCLQLLPFAPLGSQSQMHLLRRIAEHHRGRQWIAGSPGLHDATQHVKCLQMVLTNAHTLLRRGSTESRSLTILYQSQWQRAMQLFDAATPRVQAVTASHLIRLIISANVWLRMEDNYMRSLVRLAMRHSQGGGSSLAEDVLSLAVHQGLWHAGLRFQQLLQSEVPLLLHQSVKARQYSSQLCHGLLQRTSLAKTVAMLTKRTRQGQWEAASECFIQYVTKNAESPLLHCTKYPDAGASHGSSPMTSSVGTYPTTGAAYAALPAELSFVAHAVRFSMLQTPSPNLWRVALDWFPTAVLPLPHLHEQLVRQRFGAVTSSPPEQVVEQADAVPCGSPVAPSMSFVEAARCGDRASLREHLHRRSERRVTVGAALKALHATGDWQTSLYVFEEATRCDKLPYESVSTVLTTLVDGGAPWESTLRCFAHASSYTRPDVMCTVAAMRACSTGQQWEMAFRVLKQSVLTQHQPVPQVVDLAISTALHCGIWSRALHAAEMYQRTSNSSLAHTVLQTYVATQHFSEAVEYFYACSVRGLRPLDASVELALSASDSVSEEYRQLARMAGAVASALEDLFVISGVILEHLMVVHRQWRDKEEDSLFEKPYGAYMSASFIWRTPAHLHEDSTSLSQSPPLMTALTPTESPRLLSPTSGIVNP